MTRFFFFATALACTARAFGQSGMVDPAFRFDPLFEPQRTLVRHILSTTNGSFFASGNFGIPSSPQSFTLFHFLDTGDLDLDFNVGALEGGGIEGFAVQSSGKLIVGGSFSKIGGFPRFGVARLNPDGSADDSFVSFYNDTLYARGVTLLSDNRILLFGDFAALVDGLKLKRGIVLLQANGALDKTSNFVLSGGLQSVYHVAVQSNDKLLLFGSFTDVQGFPKKWLARVSPNGQLDLGFSPPELSHISSPLSVPPNIDISLQSDGKILLWGDMKVGENHYQLLRLNSNGSIDTTFTPPIFATDQTVFQTFLIRGLVTDSAGDIYVVGSFTHVNETRHQCIVKLFPDGSVDESFALEFNESLLMSNQNALAAISLQSNNKCLISAERIKLDDGTVFAMARLTLIEKPKPSSRLSIYYGAESPTIEISGTVDHSYRIESSTDLSSTNWSILGDVFLITSPKSIQATNFPGEIRQFYRSRSF